LSYFGGNLGIGITPAPQRVTLMGSSYTSDLGLYAFTGSGGSGTRNWQILTNYISYGDFGIQTSTVKDGVPNVDRFYISENGVLKIPDLGGIGTRQVVADAGGNLLATANPAKPIRSVTATTAALTSDFTILADATTGAITVNLPIASTCTGLVLCVKKTNNTANNITIDPNGAEAIDFGVTSVISTYLQTVMFQSNGIGWFIIN